MFPAGGGPSLVFERLRDPQLYAAAIDRLRSRESAAGQARPLAVDGPWLQAIGDARGLARALARDVVALEYRFAPMQQRRARIRGQDRTLYAASPIDEIVLAALATVVSEAVEARLEPNVYSYRRGRSSLAAVQELCAHLRAHRASRRERRSWGLYVLRRDVKGYGDSIPSGPDSPFWAMLYDTLAAGGEPVTGAQKRWLREAFRPAISAADGATSRPSRGIPTGSPLQPAACNLHLTPIDRLLASVPGGFYARYGDDMLFAHPDPKIARQVGSDLDRELRALELGWSHDKCSDLYFNLAGRSSEEAPEFRAAAALSYLGFRIDFRGVIGLKREKLRVLLRELSVRLAHSRRLLSAVPPASRALDLCEIANAALDPGHANAAAAAAPLRYVVSDRSQLRDLDYKIALLVAEQLSSRRGVRAFRTHPPARLHSELGLVSLVSLRNRVGRSAHA